MIIPKKKAKNAPAPADAPSAMSTTRFEMGLEILAELDTPSMLALLETKGPAEGEDLAPASASQENGAIVGLLASALKGRLLRRLSAVALASEDELEAADEDPDKMTALVRLRGRADWQENFQAVKGFFSRLGISNLATLASFALNQAGTGAAGVPPQEPSRSEG